MKRRVFTIAGCGIILLLNCPLYSDAQLKADFSASVTSGCAPLVVQFLDASTGNPNEWSWDLGDSIFSTRQSPAAVYENPGTYNVTLTIKNAGSQNTVVKNAFITVYANPQVGFTTRNDHDHGCVPLEVGFEDGSTAGGGAITDWLWNFGDGSISNEENPLHTYSTANSFDVSLTVKNSYGCQQTLQQIQFIDVKPGIKTDFTYNYKNACTFPSSFSFLDATKSADSLSYQWFFGDGTASTLQNPIHTYNLPGNFNVTLIARGQSSACNDTINKTIVIGNPLANFSLPNSICLNTPLLFQDSSLPEPLSVSWDFGDGSNARGSNDMYHTYSSNGTYTIKMVADFGGCSATEEKTIVVAGNSQASFNTSGNLISCRLPQTINFTNQSSGAVTYEWNFGDGSFSNNINPAHTYTSPGNYQVTLVAISKNGCADTSTQNNLIQLNPLQITGLQNAPFKGCAPQTVNFNALINTSQPVVSYKWSFGDGSGSAIANPSHNYSYAGGYTVSLIAATQNGCTDTFTLGNAVALGIRPFPAFDAQPVDVCASKNVEFTDLSRGIITGWFWDFGDTTFSTDQNPKHRFQDTGYFSVKLVVESNGCRDSLIKKNVVYIEPPISDFIFKVNCGDPFEIEFLNRVIGARTLLWDFGDGDTSALRHPFHRYRTIGSYPVSLTVTNGTCSDTKDTVVRVIRDYGEIDYKPELADICKYDTVKFRVLNYDSSLINYFEWNFGDSSGTGPNGNIDSIYHVYTGAGNYEPYLVIKNIYACSDTVYNKNFVKVFGPTAAFLAAPAACRDSLVTFNDLSVPYQNNSITTWRWDFGDGVTNAYKAPPFTHSYSYSGKYNVKLKIIDSKGCYDTSFSLNSIKISASFLDAGANTAICPGDTVTLQASGAETYTWQGNSLSCIDCASPVANPNVTTVYHLSGTNNRGCTSQDSVIVKVEQPFTMQLIDADTLCIGSSDVLNASGTDQYQWVPSDNSQTLYGSSVTVKPSSDVTYTVIGSDNTGCFTDTAHVALYVYPYPQVTFPNSIVSISAGSQYQLQPIVSSDVNAFLWTPNTGLNSTTIASPVAQPKATTTYTLQVSNEGNCSASNNITIQVICGAGQIFIPNTFSPNGDGMNDVFFPRGNGIYSVRSFRIFNRWGQLVFERTNTTANKSADGWDGQYQGRPLNTDVYIYQIEVVCDNNQIIPLQGNITLIR